MPPVKPDLIRTAARRRAAGAAWQAIADGLKRPLSTVEKWPGRYPELWAQYAAEAEAEVLRDGRNEARAVVRLRLRDRDAKTSLAAAAQFLKLDGDGDRAAAPAADPDAVRQAQYARGLTDDDLDRLAADAARCRAPAGGVLPPPGPD